MYVCQTEKSKRYCFEMIFTHNAGSSSRSVLQRDWIRGHRPASRWRPRETRCHHVCERTGAQCDQVHHMPHILHLLCHKWINDCCLCLCCFHCAVLISSRLHDVSVLVHRGWQRDFRTDVKNGENVPCWFIHNNGTGLVDGDTSDYIVSGLFKRV